MSRLESSLSQSKQNNKTAHSPLDQALLLIDNGEYKLAQTMLRTVLNKDPQNAKAMRWLGYCFDQAKDYKNALVCYKQWNKFEPCEQSYFQLGMAHLNVLNFNLARENLQQALGCIDYESPNLFDIYKHLGNLALRFGDIESAEENYNRAYTLSPHSDALIVNMGTLEVQKGDWGQAGEYFRTAIELNQQNDNAWIGLAMSYRSISDHELAYGAVEKGLDINPTNLVGLRLLIEWAFTDLNYGGAIERLKTYLEKSSHDEDMSFCLASLLYKAGHIRDASIEIQRARELAPQREDVIQLEMLLQKQAEL
ncbi:MAG: tetratricopeptide repeat protein [Bdellovibrionales bacterium]